MNQQQALDLAGDHRIVVTIDHTKRVQENGQWKRVVSFKVGDYTITQISGHVWRLVDARGYSYTDRRGACMKFAIDLILNDRLLAKA
jgi:hypothetical protein